MKLSTLILILMGTGLALFVVGCETDNDADVGPQGTSPAVEPETDVDMTDEPVTDLETEADRLGQEMEGTMRQAGAQLARQKEQFINSIQNQTQQLSTNLQQLQQKVQGAGAEIQQEYDDQVKEFQQRLSDLERKIGAAQEAGEQAWPQIRQDLADTYEDLSDAMHRAREHYDELQQQGAGQGAIQPPQQQGQQSTTPEM